MSDRVATEVKRLNGFTGDARLYRLSEPVAFGYDYDTEQYEKSTEYVVVSATHAMFSGPETYIFPASETGEVANWCELDGSFKGALDHETALNRAGYTVQNTEQDAI